MAIAWRIEPNGISTPGDGSVTIKYTAGPPPLPAAWAGTAMTFAGPGGRDALAAAVQGVAAKLTEEDWVLLQTAKGIKADPTLGLGFKTAVEGKNGAFDPTGLVAILTIG